MSSSDREALFLVELRERLKLTREGKSRSARLISSVEIDHHTIRCIPTEILERKVEPLCFDIEDILEQDGVEFAIRRISCALFEHWIGVGTSYPTKPIMLPSDIDSFEQEISDTFPSPFMPEIVRACINGNSLLVFGRSASGKTVAAKQAASTLVTKGADVLWLDLSEPAQQIADLLAFLLCSTVDRPVIVFVDDAQANPGLLEECFRVHSATKFTDHLPFVVCLLSWESYRHSIQDLWTNIGSIVVRPEPVLKELISAKLSEQFSETEREQLTQMASGDLVAAQLAISIMNREGRFPSRSEMSDEALSLLTGSENVDLSKGEILYRVAALSQFEIDMSIAYLSNISEEALVDLLTNKVLRRSGNYVSIGHRSSARFVLSGLKELFPELIEKIPNPTRLAVNYLRASNPDQLMATLERLDVARFHRATKDQHGTRFLVNLWQTLRSLLEALSRVGEQDSTWGDDTGSATLAIRSLNEFGYDSAQKTLQLQRKRWLIDLDGTNLQCAPPVPNERKDFTEIRQCMLEEESRGSIPSYAERAEHIDLDRMHRTWILGFLLEQEAASTSLENARLRALKRFTAAEQLPNGSFYPARVPWITARVLIGLVQAGETVDSSDTVRRACSWLLTETPEGPCNFGSWPAWTGVWNTVLGTTAMCLNALIRSGVTLDDPTIELAIQYLIDGKDEWSRTGQEIDCAFALETLLLANYNWRTLTNELQFIRNWAQDPSIWENVVLDASQAKDESLKIPLVTVSLVGIIWGIVRSELPLLLEDLATGIYLPMHNELETPHTDIRTIIQRLEEISSEIRTGIEHRLRLLSKENAVGAEEIQTKLRELREFSIQCDETHSRAQKITLGPREKNDREELNMLRNATNSLGQSVFGDAWKRLGDL